MGDISASVHCSNVCCNLKSCARSDEHGFLCHRKAQICVTCKTALLARCWPFASTQPFTRICYWHPCRKMWPLTKMLHSQNNFSLQTELDILKPDMIWLQNNLISFKLLRQDGGITAKQWWWWWSGQRLQKCVLAFLGEHEPRFQKSCNSGKILIFSKVDAFLHSSIINLKKRFQRLHFQLCQPCVWTTSKVYMSMTLADIHSQSLEGGGGVIKHIPQRR